MAAEYFEYLKAIGSLSSQYEDCPFECPNAEKKYDIARKKNCTQCPRKRQKDVFEKQSKEIVAIKLGEEYKFNFEKTLGLLHRISALEGLAPDKLTNFNSYLVGILVDERGKSRD